MRTWMQDFPALAERAEDFLRVCHRLYEKDYVRGYDGNISLRLGDTLLVTPTHRCKGDLTQASLLVVDRQGNVLSGDGAPSSELKLHLAVYDAQPTLCAVVHAHPLYATAYYRDSRTPNTSLLMEAGLSLGDDVPVVPFLDHGTRALADAVGAAMRPEVCACVMARHGTVTVGDDLWQAYFRTESLERLAHTETILATANF